MKTKLFYLFAAALATCALTFSCNDGDGGYDSPSNAENLAGSIYDAKTLDSNMAYTITGPVIVEDGGSLTIPAGTTIKAKKGFSSYILVLQGGKIFVNGTAEAPVKITSAETSPKAADWGGLIINGKARITGYDAKKDATWGRTEIANAYVYGGTNDADNSGSITYLILEYTGSRATIDIEHNGLTLNAVGSGTKIENIFVPNGADDGIEFFGGSVNVNNILIYNSDDDMFDFTYGWNGELKNGYGIWDKGYSSTEKDPRGIEGDGNLDGLMPTATPQSDCKFTDITVELRLDYYKEGPELVAKAMQDAVKIRRGAKATITNMLVKGTGHVQDMVDFSDSAGAGNPASVVNIINGLTAPTGGTNPDRQLNPATGYNGVTITNGTTGGCNSAVFGWVKKAGYNIF